MNGALDQRRDRRPVASGLSNLTDSSAGVATTTITGYATKAECETARGQLHRIPDLISLRSWRALGRALSSSPIRKPNRGIVVTVEQRIADKT
jgi:hypothetical protein